MTAPEFTGTHVGPYDALDDYRRRDFPADPSTRHRDDEVARLGAEAPSVKRVLRLPSFDSDDLRQLMKATFTGNPYQRGSR